jgi:hypothetical protein
MSEVKLSAAGEQLLAADSSLPAVLDEMALDDDPGNLNREWKSYQGEQLGNGAQAIVFSVKGQPHLAEKAWRTRPRSDYQEVAPTFWRNELVRHRWEKDRPGGSRLYVPEYYAYAETSRGFGAILMERVGGKAPVTPAELQRAEGLAVESLSRQRVAARLDVPSEALTEVWRRVATAMRREDSFYRELLTIAPVETDEPMATSTIVDYDANATGVEAVRLSVVDL